jgi:small-conductance mechanosensitive channel
MQKTTGAVPESEPFIRYHTIGDSAIKFSVILRGKEFTDQYLIKHEFIKLIIAKYREHAIEIPFPVRQLLIDKPIAS